MKALLSLCLCVIACSSSESSRSAASSRDSAVEFVQRFYDWYVPLGNQPTIATRYDSLARNEHGWFSPALAAALKNDLDVQRRDTTGDIVSITAEYDPFVASQDPCERYQAREEQHLAGRQLVSVFPVCGGKVSEKPAVLVEVAGTQAGIRIVNFRSPGDPASDLLKALANTRADTTHRRPD